MEEEEGEEVGRKVAKKKGVIGERKSFLIYF